MIRIPLYRNKILIYDYSHLNFFSPVLVSLNMVDDDFFCVCVCDKTEDPQKEPERKEGMALSFKVSPLQYLHRFSSRTCRGDCERIACDCTRGP